MIELVLFYLVGVLIVIRGMAHLLPVKAHQAVRGKLMLPDGWGTFDLGLLPWYEPIERFLIVADQADVDYLTPKIGEVVNPEQVGGREAWWKPFINKTQ